jgi:hypothetical protein
LIWNPDVNVATPYHISLHYIASLSLAFALLLTNSSLTLERSNTPTFHLEVADAP